MSYGSEIRIYLKSVHNIIKVFERKIHVLPKNAAHLMEGTCHHRGGVMANTKPIILDELLKRLVAFHGYPVRKGGITFELMFGRMHGTIDRDEDQ